MEVRSWIHHLMAHADKIHLVNEVILDAEFEPGTEHEGPGGICVEHSRVKRRFFVCAVFFDRFASR